MAEKKKKGFLSRIKDSLKIRKVGLSGANKELRKKRGTTQKKDVKMASFRVSNKDNRRLQSETKDARRDTVSYTKVNKKNKAQLSDQHKVKPKTKSSNTGKKMSAIEKRNRERFGDAHVDKLKARHKAFKEARRKKKK